jgi:DNA-binding NarL/FixJ family response regulator
MRIGSARSDLAMKDPTILTCPLGHHKIRVMLIDDRTLFLRSVLTFLQQVSEVQLVGTVGAGEWTAAQAKLLGAEIVILDLASAGLPGLPNIAALRAAFPEIGVIVLTLLDMAPYRQVALAAGAAEFVSRVSAGIDLLPAIRRVAAALEESSRCQAPS